MGQKGIKEEWQNLKVTKRGIKMVTRMVSNNCGKKSRKPQNMGKNSL